MTLTEWWVVAGGIALMAWVNWYFLLGSRSIAGPAASESEGVQEVTIRVEGGYDPAAFRLRAGRPARLVFERQEKSGCSEEIVLADFGIRRFLPPFQKTVVEFTPRKAGRFEFTCGMGMLRGHILVEDGVES